MDQAKVKQALAEDYDSVAQLFIRSKDGLGVGARVSRKLRNFNNYSSGVITTKLRGLERIIENQDENINRKQRQLQQKEQSIRRRFSRLEGRLMDMQSEGNFLAQRFGAQGGGGGASQGGGGQ